MPLQFLADAQVLSLTNRFGIYIHIPFCAVKCNYCNFYSVTNGNIYKEYCNKVIRELTQRGRQTARPVSSVYIGGGTPTVLGGQLLSDLLSSVKENFNVSPDCEITVEANPGDDLESILPDLYKAGYNRLSFGAQSANEEELQLLGRRHGVNDIINAVKTARKCGFRNISLDLMIGLPESNPKKLENSLKTVCELSPEHISAYILKLENGTKLQEISHTLNMPDDDSIADQYLLLCKHLKASGYNHYEISNFAKPGFEGRHNINYWKCGEYLGFGPAAHSFFEGKRFYCEPDIKKYLENPCYIPDGIGGTPDEYIMLGLRLSDGISSDEFKEKFNTSLPRGVFDKARLYQKEGLCITDGRRISLTSKGMLVSNSIITSFIEELE